MAKSGHLGPLIVDFDFEFGENLENRPILPHLLSTHTIRSLLHLFKVKIAVFSTFSVEIGVKYHEQRITYITDNPVDLDGPAYKCQ